MVVCTNLNLCRVAQNLVTLHSKLELIVNLLKNASFIFCGLDKFVLNAELQPAFYGNFKMVNNLTVAQKLPVWQDYRNFGMYDHIRRTFFGHNNRDRIVSI